jgi:uncharacterized membrane protein YqaE (UPF0057 family)
MMEPLVNLAYDLATLVVQLVVAISIPLLAVNVARGAASAQIANAVGNYLGVSQAWMNLISAVLVFAVTALCPVVIGLIADALQAYVVTEIVLPRWGGSSSLPPAWGWSG